MEEAGIPALGFGSSIAQCAPRFAHPLRRPAISRQATRASEARKLAPFEIPHRSWAQALGASTVQGWLRSAAFAKKFHKFRLKSACRGSENTAVLILFRFTKNGTRA
jgi:hypothetical protein